MPPDDTKLEITGSRNLPRWLAEQNLSLAFTTYQAGKLFLVGRGAPGRLSVFERTFTRSMGMCATDQTLWMSSLYQIWRLENALEPGASHNGYDRLYIPRVGYTTGDVDTHDVAVEGSGRVVFISTSLSCLATLSETRSLKPIWQPPFISKLAPEDRCHLNGLALERGRARYVTAVSTADVADGWRDHRDGGGVVIDIGSDEIIATGLSMPHSPRWYKGRLWVLNSGTGEFGYIDLAEGCFVPVVFCPGFLRGLVFAGNHAVVGLSGPRDNCDFGGLALDGSLRERNAQARCGLQIIDLATGSVVHWLRIEGVIKELYDVAVLPGVVRPMALGFQTSEIQQLLSLERDDARS